MTKADTVEQIRELDPNTNVNADDYSQAELDAELKRLQGGTGDEAGTTDATASVASREDNAALEHSVGGTTTRSDKLDAGVPMLQGDPSEPVGPEDAFGDGEKRGDYSGRVERGPHMVSVPNPKAGAPIYAQDADGNDVVVDYEPNAILVDQETAAQLQGDIAGVKGGVGT